MANCLSRTHFLESLSCLRKTESQRANFLPVSLFHLESFFFFFLAKDHRNITLLIQHLTWDALLMRCLIYKILPVLAVCHFENVYPSICLELCLLDKTLIGRQVLFCSPSSCCTAWNTWLGVRRLGLHVSCTTNPTVGLLDKWPSFAEPLISFLYSRGDYKNNATRSFWILIEITCRKENALYIWIFQ